MKIEEIFDRFNDVKVLVIGDLMLDSYTIGKVERISPEAPVPILNVEHRDVRLGGAGNVILNLKNLGATPVIFSVVGNDEKGKVLLNLLMKDGISVDNIIKSSKRFTTVKERIIASGQQIVRIDDEVNYPVDSDETTILIEEFLKVIDECDVVLFEDYDKGVITPQLIENVIRIANSKGIPVLVDPKKRNFLSYNNTTLFKPNLKELKEGLGVEIDENDFINSLKNSIERLKIKMSLEGAFITLSERGVVIDFRGEFIHIPAHVRSIADVSGAGDTVI